MTIEHKVADSFMTNMGLVVGQRRGAGRSFRSMGRQFGSKPR